MESAAVRRVPALPGLIQAGLIILLLALAAGAWAVTDARMGGMDAGPGTGLGDLGFFLTAWVVMMAAMMFPSIAPMVLMQVRMQEGRRERGESSAAGTTTLFVAGYLLAWTGAGLVAYGVFVIGVALTGDLFAWDNGGRYLAAAIVLGAAVYQLTPLKDVCLRHCRSPIGFLISYWRPGRAGALRMGVIHGGWCVGCCWALMAALFAVGVMSLGWMAFIAALIALEKLLPMQALANRGIAVLLVALGLGLALSPSDVPGLTVPGSPDAVRAMQSMEGGDMGGGSVSGGSMKDEKGSMGDKRGDSMDAGDSMP
jgi:predicted metal-binding membrane protein